MSYAQKMKSLEKQAEEIELKLAKQLEEAKQKIEALRQSRLQNIITIARKYDLDKIDDDSIFHAEFEAIAKKYL